MDEAFTTRKLLVLRKLTRAVADLLRGQLKNHLITLEPLLKPRMLYGEHIQGHGKEMVRGADKYFRELQADFAAVVGARPFNISARELKSPFEVMSATLEMNALEYAYSAKTDRDTKQVVITSPLKWVFTLSGYSAGGLRKLLADRNRTEQDMKAFALHFLLVEALFTKQMGISDLLRQLNFHVVSEKWPEFGGLPITFVRSSVSTYRPPDDVIIESTEISGSNAFEEFVEVDDIVHLQDGFKEQLLEIVKSQAPELLPR